VTGSAARLARRWLPWLVAAAILAVLTARLPRAQLLRALAAGPSWKVALCSAAVVGAALVIAFTGFRAADAIASGLIALLILPRTWDLLREAIDVLLEATPKNVNYGRGP